MPQDTPTPKRPSPRKRPARPLPARALSSGAPSPQAKPGKTPIWKILEATATIAAFLLSLGVFLLGGLQTLSGPEIVLVEPQFIYLYRDAPQPENDALVVAAEAAMINTARADFGDVATEAYAEFQGASGSSARFMYEATVEPVDLHGGENRGEACPVNARCVLAEGNLAPEPGQLVLMMIEQRRAPLDIPGGSARSVWLNFPLSNCRGSAASCGQYERFDDAVARLRERPISVRITLDFYRDGPKTLTCRLENDNPQTREALLDFLEARGWAALRCQRDPS